MAGIRLDWAQFGHFDSFSVYRSATPMLPESLPAPIATGVNRTSWWDSDVVPGTIYYYRVEVMQGANSKLSDELSISATSGVSDLLFSDVVLLIDAQVDAYPSILFTDKSNSRSAVTTSATTTNVPTMVGATTTPPILNDGSIYLPNSSLLYAPIGANTVKFTFEWFMKLPSNNNANEFIRMDENPTSSGRGTLNIYGAGDKLGLAIGGYGFIQPTTASTIKGGQWQHYCITKDGGSIRFFVDGVLIGMNDANGYGMGVIQGFIVFKGFDYYINAIRMTRNQHRYPLVGFTPPDAPFPAQ